MLRKQGNFTKALSICNEILNTNPKYNTVLYHKERVLFLWGTLMNPFYVVIEILDDYPDNGDVLFDKSRSFVMLSKNDEALNLLERAISHGIQYKIKAKKSKSFEKLLDDSRFQNLIL